MAFWGCAVKPGKETAFVPPPEADEKLHVSQACLAPGASPGARATLMLRVSDGEPLAVAALREGASESASLDLVLDCYTEFTVVGSAAIHLTGYFMPEYEIGEGGDDEEHDHEEEDGDLELEEWGGREVLGIDEFGQPVFADEYDSEMDSDYSSGEGGSEDDDEFDSAEEELFEAEEGARRRRSDVTIEDITELLEQQQKGKKKAVLAPPEPVAANGHAKGKKAAEFADDDVSGSDEEEDSESEEEEDEAALKVAAAAVAKAAAADAKKAKAAEAQKVKAEKAAAAKAEKKRKAEEPAAAAAPKQKKEKKDKEAAAPADGGKSPAGAKERVRRFANGFEVEDLAMGSASGKLAKPGKKVSVRYVGKLKSGKVFDQTKGSATFSFRLGVGEVVKGFDRGVEGMRVGDKRRVTIPPQMGYGSAKTGPIPPNSTLVFDLELVDVKG